MRPERAVQVENTEYTTVERWQRVGCRKLDLWGEERKGSRRGGVLRLGLREKDLLGWEKAAVFWCLSKAWVLVRGPYRWPCRGAKAVAFWPCVRLLSRASCSSYRLQKQLRRCLITQHRGDQVSTVSCMFAVFSSEQSLGEASAH